MEINAIRNKMRILNLAVNKLVGDFERETGYSPSLIANDLDVSTVEGPKVTRYYKVEVTL